MRTYFGLAALLLAGCDGQNSGNSTEALTGSPSASSSSATEIASVGTGPFGFGMGERIEGLKLEKGEKVGFYSTTTPPKSHDAFENVIIEAYPSTGICMIRGVGKDLTNDGSGSRVIAEVDSLAEAMAEKYGKGQKLDRCSGGDVQCMNQFWMMTLNGGERFYGHKWTGDNASMKSAKIDEIYVFAQAGDINTSYPMVEYTSSDKACGKARRGASASSL